MGLRETLFEQFSVYGYPYDLKQRSFQGRCRNVFIFTSNIEALDVSPGYECVANLSKHFLSLFLQDSQSAHYSICWKGKRYVRIHYVKKQVVLSMVTLTPYLKI